ncbi:MAG: hypothetical protein AEth_00326 [Candidatus Argoarchaeum ethanivorans]|uniref:Uncharacterized protein n=1 Tax=Candidatus Argoarchaeum ethanivorans TaxID=2608793 RepID=A0A8B3S6W7_9EURY|nr:MAG: hypothetical protein AEth_00326 [Candidatus Argoarchaeum ethanivorans]
MTIKLVNIKVDDPPKEGRVEVFIEDLCDYPAHPKEFLGCTYKRNAIFSFSISERGITSSNEVEFGNSMEKKKLVWYQDKKDEKYKGLGNCFACSVRLYYLISSIGKDEKFSYYQWKISPPGYWSRDIQRPYRVTISNRGEGKISYDAVISGVKK